ncbi:T9SS type A sorting domain-containing protein [uncultured Microscilla sp.]|uniref:T9SS type A sorting domain-containing protein n=1 Tax=uncultured Microscilla sp. TaxID=432653 RepID=UPI0026185617|nr:T9SS type A sorting domain-containing protein [uncultured Microscilla sp.]
MNFQRFIKVLKVFAITFLFIPQIKAQIVATWNPGAGAMAGGFYTNLKEKNWYNPANWSWTVSGGAADPTHASVPDNGIPDINTNVVIPGGTAVCWIPPNNTNYCIDATTNANAPAVGNAPCSGNFVQATDPLAASITINGGALYNEAGSGVGSPSSLQVAGNVTINNGGGTDGVLMLETPITKIDGNLDITNNGHFVIVSGQIQVELQKNINIDGTITKLQTSSNGIFTINFVGASDSYITGNNKSNVSSASAALTPYLNFSRFTSGAFDNILVNKSVSKGNDFFVRNTDNGMPILSGVVDGSGSLILASTGNFAINKGTVEVKNATANTSYQTFAGSDGWSWRINDPDINIRGKLFIANADVGTVSYKGASLDLWHGGLANKEDITMHLGGSLEDLNVYYPSETNDGESRGGLYIGSVSPSAYANQSRPVIVFNGQSSQDIRGLNGNGTSDQLQNFANNPSEGVGLALPNVIYNPANATSRLTINVSNNLRILGHLLITQGTFSLNSRKLLFGDKVSVAQSNTNITSYNYGDEINVYGKFELSPNSILKMSTGGTSYGTILRVRKGGSIESSGTADQNVNITRDGTPGKYYRIAAYSGATVRIVYTLFELITGSNTGYALPGTGVGTDNTTGGTHSNGGFKCYAGSVLATDIDHDSDPATNPVTSFSYCTMNTGGFYLSFITINTGQTIQIEKISFGDTGGQSICTNNGCTPNFRNVVANGSGAYTITMYKTSGSTGGTRTGELHDGGAGDANIIWTGPTPIYWLGPQGIPMASSHDKVNKNNTSIFRKWSDSNADGTPDNLGWSLSPTAYVAIDPDPSKIPGSAGFTNFDVYVPSTCSRNLLIDDDYTLDGGYFFLEYFASTSFSDGSVWHGRRYRRSAYLEDGKTLTLGGDFINGGASSYRDLGGVFYAGTNSNLHVAGSFFTNFGRSNQGEVASSIFEALNGSTVLLNGTENQELRLRTNALYNLTIDKASGTVVTQGLSGATYYSQIIQNKFLMLNGGFVIRSTCPLVIQGDYEQQGGSVDFDLSPITVQGNFKVTGGSLIPTSSTTYFIPNTTAERVIQLDASNVKFNKVVFTRNAYLPTAGHNNSTNFITSQTYQPSSPVTTVTSGIVKYSIASSNNNFEVLNDVIIENNRHITLSEDLIATTGNITIKDKGELSTSAGTQFQIRSAQTLLVEDGGTLNVIGSVSKYAKVSRMGVGNDAYSFKVNGTLKARYYLIEFTDADGVNLSSTAKTLSPGVIIVGGGGENYSAKTGVSIVGGGGIGATAKAEVTASITKINVSNQGGGYTAAPNVTIAPPGSGTQATATAIIKGPVTGMYMTNGGEYSVLPNLVNFTGGGGSGASGVIKAGIKNVNLTSAGAKYSSAPTIAITGGGGSGAIASTKLDAEVVGYTVTEGGSGYVTVPSIASIDIDHSATNNSANATIAGISCTVTGAKDFVAGSGYDNTTTVTIVGGTFTVQATAVPVISGGQLVGISITNPGSGYTSAPTGITISGPGTGASCTPTLSIESLTLGTGGAGYETAPAINFPAPPTATDAPTSVANAVANLSGAIKTITVDNSGQGYTSTPNISIQSPGATASANVTSGQVTSVNVEQGGAYYTNAPTVTFDSGTASAYAVVENGVVTQVVVTNGGSGYAVPPKVTLSLPTGAVQATASLTMTINEVALNSGGLNYDTPPTVSLSGGTTVGGDNASIAATMSVQSISITNSGSGYTNTSLPNITIQTPEPGIGIGVANGAIAAKATAETVGEITAINVITNGADYTSTPYIIINDTTGTGRGAAATPILAHTTVSNIPVIDGGYYTSVPTVTISGGIDGGGTNATATAVMVRPTFDEIAKAIINTKGTGCNDGTHEIDVPGGTTTAKVLVTVVGGVVAGVNVKAFGTGYGSDVDISSLVNAAPCGCSGASVTALKGSRIDKINVVTPGSLYTGTPTVTITPTGGNPNQGDGAALAYLAGAQISSIVLTPKNVYPAATFSDGIFTNGYNRDNAGGSVNGVFITFPENYSAYRNGTNAYSTEESLPASVTHDYQANPVVDTIYNVLFPQNPTRITNPFHSNNVRRIGTSSNTENQIVFKDALGTFSGEDYDDETSPNNTGDGLVIWVEPNIVRWDGGPSSSGTSWRNPNNWRPNGIPTPDKHVIIDYQLMSLQYSNPAGPGTVIAPTNFLVQVDLDPVAHPITCRSLTIETLIPGPNPSNARGAILLELDRPMTILESFSASAATTTAVKNPAATMSIGGSWSNEGRFIHGGGTVEFNQPLTRTINATSGITESYSEVPAHSSTATVGEADEHANAFYNLTLSDGTTELNSYIRVENDLSIKNAGTRLNPSNDNNTIELWGKWQNEGNFEPKAGKVIFASNLDQTVSKGFRTIATATAALTGDKVTGITRVDDGEKYAIAPQVILEGGGGYGAKATASIDTDGKINGLTITDQGNAYTSAPTVVFVPIDKESFHNVDIYKSANHVTLLTRTEITNKLDFKANNIVSDTLRECIVGGTGSVATNALTTGNGYVDGPMGRLYNTNTDYDYYIGKETSYPGPVKLDFTLDGIASSNDEDQALYIIERFNALPVDGRIIPASADVNVLLDAHYRVYQAPYPFINSSYAKDKDNNDLNFAAGKIGLPLTLDVESITTQALTGTTIGLGTIATANLDNYRILQDPGDVNSSLTSTQKGLDSEVPYHTVGASWINLGGENTVNADIGESTIINNVTSFSQLGSGTFAMGIKYSALPVDYITLKATPQGKKVLLEWTSFSEADLSHYEVEKSVDGQSFIKIGDQVALGKQGLTQTYTAIDAQPINGINYYRIKVYDKDGKFQHSKMVSAEVSFTAGFTIFPNPNNGDYVKISSEVSLPNEEIQLTITDISGKTVYTQTIGAGSRSNANTIELNSLNLSSGLHFINLSSTNLSTRLKLIISK